MSNSCWDNKNRWFSYIPSYRWSDCTSALSAPYRTRFMIKIFLLFSERGVFNVGIYKTRQTKQTNQKNKQKYCWGKSFSSTHNIVNVLWSLIGLFIVNVEPNFCRIYEKSVNQSDRLITMYCIILTSRTTKQPSCASIMLPKTLLHVLLYLSNPRGFLLILISDKSASFRFAIKIARQSTWCDSISSDHYVSS